MVLASHRDVLHCLHYTVTLFLRFYSISLFESASFLEPLNKYCLFYHRVPDNLIFFLSFFSSPFSIQNVAMTNSKEEHVF